MNQGALHFDALLSVNNFDAGISRIKNGIRDASGVAKREAESMDSAFRNLGTAIGGYFSAQTLFSFTKELINVRGEFQKTEIAFSTMLGSADKARVLMGQMVDLATKTPFSLQEVSAGAKQLLAFQVPANQVVDVLTRMGNIAAGLGVPLARLNLVYGQVMAKGRLMGDDLRQFTEAGIPMVAELAKKFNKTTAEITEMVSAGKIGFKDVQDVLFNLTNEGGMFFNLMEKQSASLSGKVANLGDAWDQMLNKIGEGSEGVLYSGIEGLTYLVEHYQDLLNIVEALVITYGSYKAAVIVASAAQTFANKTVQSEIALLSISEKMKLGRAMVTQRQAEATAREAAAEVTNLEAKYAAMRAETSLLVSKKATLRQSGLTSLAVLQEAKLQLSLAQMELSSLQATGSAREIEIAQKRVTIAQNSVLSSQATATIAKNAAIANSVALFNNREALKISTQRISIAQNASATASEVAQTAAKNANAIATTRLTIATRFRTAATQLATQAQVLLNATMLNNPIVLVIAAIAGLTYAYFRLRDTSTALSIAEKQLNEERKRSSEYIENLKNKTQELTSIINSDTATKLQQVEAYNLLSKMMPDLLKNMDLETFKKIGNTEAQKKLNAEIDKYSTQNISNQVASAQGKIQELTSRINQLNEALKKRNGDSGLQLNELEFATKNLEAQKINLEKYNAELKQRLENEKISSMNLAEQKKYWEDQVISIKNQVSGLEKSNAKKAESIDKLNSISALTKSTSINLLNWNITPLLSQLDRARNELNKVNNSQSDKGVNKNKAFWEEQKKAATEANDAMSGKEVGSSTWNENLKKIRQSNDELKKYDYTDREFLKAQKARDKERKALEKGAEKSYLEGSIKRYDQQISLLEEALSRSTGNTVRTRFVDKYGKERDSAELQSVQDVNNQIIALREKRAEREKLIETKSFQERIDESERQWNNYYKIAEFYGKETADAQYKELFKGAQNYLQYLEKQEQALKAKASSGQILTEEDKNNIIFLQDKISDLNGTETPFENIKREIDGALKSISSLFDQQSYLENYTSGLFEKEGNSKLFLDVNKYAQDLNKNIIQQKKDTYAEFLREEETFQKKQTDIISKWDDVRNQIKESKYTPEEKVTLNNAADKNQLKEISSASFEAFKKTDLWVKAFGDLDRIGPKTLLKLKKGLQDFITSDKGKSLAPTELKETQDQIKKLDDLISSNNPYKAIGFAVDNYRKKRKELSEVEKKSGKDSDAYKEKLEETNQAFVDIVNITGAAAQATIEVVGTIGDAFGGLSDELKQTLAEVQQLIDGIVNAVAGYFSGNYGQMISGIVQIVGAMVKLLSGDKSRERQIQEWQRAVEGLKNSYDELSNSIQRTAGEASIAMNRNLVENLEEQKRLLTQMREEESKKKKADQDKITGFDSQISQINEQIKSVIENFQKSVTTTDFKDLSSNIANALIEAFGKGEDAAQAFDKVVDDVMKNAVANALRIKILEPAVKNMVDQLYSSMGFGNNSSGAQTASLKAQIDKYKEEIKKIEEQKAVYTGQGYSPGNTAILNDLNAQKQKLLDLIGSLEAQIKSFGVEGNFDGLTPEEREKIKALGLTAMQQYTAALQQYEDLFGAASENAQGLKGDIKGITEKTAGALEAQFNAVRINIVAMLKIYQANQAIFKNQLLVQSQIEINTRPLKAILKEITELNSKVKKNLAGVP